MLSRPYRERRNEYYLTTYDPLQLHDVWEDVQVNDWYISVEDSVNTSWRTELKKSSSVQVSYSYGFYRFGEQIPAVDSRKGQISVLTTSGVGTVTASSRELVSACFTKVLSSSRNPTCCGDEWTVVIHLKYVPPGSAKSRLVQLMAVETAKAQGRLSLGAPLQLACSSLLPTPRKLRVWPKRRPFVLVLSRNSSMSVVGSSEEVILASNDDADPATDGRGEFWVVTRRRERDKLVWRRLQGAIGRLSHVPRLCCAGRPHRISFVCYELRLNGYEWLPTPFVPQSFVQSSPSKVFRPARRVTLPALPIPLYEAQRLRVFRRRARDIGLRNHLQRQVHPLDAIRHYGD